MSKFTLPINWQEVYWEVIDFTDAVEVYGKMREDFFGGGRSSLYEAGASKRLVEQTVKQAHSRGIEFNYLLNATCIGNAELTRKGQKQIRNLLNWLYEMQVDTITVSLPIIAQIIKRYYPKFKISVSTLADVDCLEKAKYWDDIGVDVITLSYTGINRNFQEIKRITENTSFTSQLISNTFCKKGCPMLTLHGNHTSHASNSREKQNRCHSDYYSARCIGSDFCEPVDIIKSTWIRPEDLELYENLGIKRFKLTARGMTSEHLAEILKAYRSHSYEGNLYDLMPSGKKYSFTKKRTLPELVKEVLRIPFADIKNIPHLLGLLKIAASQELEISDRFYIDNKKLDGAIQFFMERGCMQTTCHDCNFCENLAQKAVKQENIDDYKKIFAGIVEDVITGNF